MGAAGVALILAAAVIYVAVCSRMTRYPGHKTPFIPPVRLNHVAIRDLLVVPPWEPVAPAGLLGYTVPEPSGGAVEPADIPVLSEV